jgi:hypothetical protein
MTATCDLLPLNDLLVTDTGARVITVEEAEEGRRHAAEHGDYVIAQRWLNLERHLAAHILALLEDDGPGAEEELAKD